MKAAIAKRAIGFNNPDKRTRPVVTYRPKLPFRAILGPRLGDMVSDATLRLYRLTNLIEKVRRHVGAVAPDDGVQIGVQSAGPKDAHR